MNTPTGDFLPHGDGRSDSTLYMGAIIPEDDLNVLYPGEGYDNLGYEESMGEETIQSIKELLLHARDCTVKARTARKNKQTLLDAAGIAREQADQMICTIYRINPNSDKGEVALIGRRARLREEALRERAATELDRLEKQKAGRHVIEAVRHDNTDFDCKQLAAGEGVHSFS